MREKEGGVEGNVNGRYTFSILNRLSIKNDIIIALHFIKVRKNN